MKLTLLILIFPLISACKDTKTEECENLSKFKFLEEIRVEVFSDETYGHYVMLNKCSEKQSILLLEELRKYIRKAKYKPITEICLMKYNENKYVDEFANNINDFIAKNKVIKLNIQKSTGDSIIIEETTIYVEGYPFSLND